MSQNVVKRKKFLCKSLICEMLIFCSRLVFKHFIVCGYYFQASTFKMTCYRGVSKDVVLTSAAVVQRGEIVSCHIDAKNVWDPRLLLVVTDCRFTSLPVTDNQSAPEFHFIRNKYVAISVYAEY
jgi:hypothetical protein